MRTPGKGFTSLRCILSVTARHGASSDSRVKEETPPLRGRRGGEPATPVTLLSIAPGHVPPGVRSRLQWVCEEGPGRRRPPRSQLFPEGSECQCLPTRLLDF